MKSQLITLFALFTAALALPNGSQNMNANQKRGGGCSSSSVGDVCLTVDLTLGTCDAADVSLSLAHVSAFALRME